MTDSVTENIQEFEELESVAIRFAGDSGRRNAVDGGPSSRLHRRCSAMTSVRCRTFRPRSGRLLVRWRGERFSSSLFEPECADAG